MPRLCDVLNPSRGLSSIVIRLNVCDYRKPETEENDPKKVGTCGTRVRANQS